MATNDITYTDLQKEVGHFVGYDPEDVDNWSAAVVAEVDRYIQAGYRQFLYPPAMEGVEAGYEWSFLKPTTTLDTTEDDAAQDLPSDFGRILGDFHFEPTVYAESIVIVSEHRLQQLLQRSTDTSRPKYAAIRFKDSDNTAAQVQEVAWWPIPSDAYTLTYRYEVYAGKLHKDDEPYPHGGAKYSETILESCLAVAEQRANDERSIHSANFGRLLVSAIAQDRKNGARYFGRMGEGESCASDARTRDLRQTSYDITYKGDTL